MGLGTFSWSLFLAAVVMLVFLNSEPVDSSPTQDRNQIAIARRPFWKDFVAQISFTLGNITSSWKIPVKNNANTIVVPTRAPSSSGRTTTTKKPGGNFEEIVDVDTRFNLKIPVRRPTTTTPPKPTKSQITTRRTSTKKPKLTTKTTMKPESPYQCDTKICESDDIDLLELCHDFCIEKSNTSKPPGSKVSTTTTTTTSKIPDTDTDPDLVKLPCENKSSDEIMDDNDCTCNFDLSPVCGTNSKTYSNLCILECAKKCNSGKLNAYRNIINY